MILYHSSVYITRSLWWYKGRPTLSMHGTEQNVPFYVVLYILCFVQNIDNDSVPFPPIPETTPRYHSMFSLVLIRWKEMGRALTGGGTKCFIDVC